MASQPLIDLSTIDLEQVIATREDICKVISQANGFAMLDGIVHRVPEQHLIVGYKEIRGDDWWAADHIPGRPIFPGVLQIESVGQICTYDYMQGHDIGDRFLGFGGMNNTRFRGIVEPDCRIYFVAKAHRIRKTMFTYYSQGFVDGKMVFEGEVIGIAI